MTNIDLLRLDRVPVILRADPKICVQGELIRFMAPRTIQAILPLFPLRGNAARHKSILYFQVDAFLGVEKGRVMGKAGLLAFWPLAKAVAVCLEDARSYSPLTPMGRITSALNSLADVPEGSVISMDVDQAAAA